MPSITVAGPINWETKCSKDIFKDFFFFFDYSINNIQSSIDLLLLAEHCVISMDNSQLTSDLSECVDGPVDVGEWMGRADLHSNSGLALRHHWEAETYHIDSSTCATINSKLIQNLIQN